MATTPTLAIPYPIGTDRVTDGDNAIQALAEFMDTKWAFGACTQADTGPGQNGSMWFSQCGSLGVAGGTVVNTNGIVVPRKGFYELHAQGVFSYQAGQVSGTANLFIGDGSAVWAVGPDQNGPNLSAPGAVSAMTVIQLNAGTLVRWGMNCSGQAFAGLTGGSTKAVLLARLLYPVP
jgi:hypothetical protein